MSEETKMQTPSPAPSSSYQHQPSFNHHPYPSHYPQAQYNPQSQMQPYYGMHQYPHPMHQMQQQPYYQPGAWTTWTLPWWAVSILIGIVSFFLLWYYSPSYVLRENDQGEQVFDQKKVLFLSFFIAVLVFLIPIIIRFSRSTYNPMMMR